MFGIGKNLGPLGPMGALGSLRNRDKKKPGSGTPAAGLGAGSALLSRQDQRAPDPLAM